MSFESQPGSVTGLSDDRLATAAVSLVVSELEWTPDVAPAVLDRISRDAVAYPDVFDRRGPRQSPSPAGLPLRAGGRIAGRLAVLGMVLAIIIAIVLLTATVNTASAQPHDVPIGAMRGTLVAAGGAVAGGLDAVDQEGRILHVVTEAS